MSETIRVGGSGKNARVPATSVSIRVREVGRPGRRAPLLIVHDGPEYVRRGSLLRLLNRLVEARELPAHRVALLAPADRMETYSASARYARTLLAALEELGGRRAGLGSSLGALALLHAHRLEPSAFAGLFLSLPAVGQQSTSTPRAAGTSGRRGGGRLPRTSPRCC